MITTALAAWWWAPSLARAAPDAPAPASGSAAPTAPADPDAPAATTKSASTASPAAAAQPDLPSPNPDALVPLNTGKDRYDEPLAGKAERATAPEPGAIGVQRALVPYTSIATYVMVGAGSAQGEGAVPSGTGVVAELELVAVSRARSVLALGGSYLKMVDAERRVARASIRGGYRVWGGVNGRFIGFAPGDLLVRSTRSILFAVGSVTFVNFGNFSFRNEDGDFVHAPDDSIEAGFGFTFEQRRENLTVRVNAEAVREPVRGAWGARGRLVVHVHRFSGALAFSDVEGVLQQTQLTAGLVF